MGMDVYGKKPVSTTGEYFRNNVWWWRPLWVYCQEVSTLARTVEGSYNDGHGLDEAGAKQLAQELFTELHSGRTAEWSAKYRTELDQLPLEDCDLCAGTGIMTVPDTDFFGQRLEPGTRTCHVCQGKGQRKPWASNYPFSIDNVRDFAEFLQDSGGFEIW